LNIGQYHEDNDNEYLIISLWHILAYSVANLPCLIKDRMLMRIFSGRRIITSDLCKAHERRDSLTVSYRRLSWSVSIHFVAIRPWNVHCSQKSQKKH